MWILLKINYMYVKLKREAHSSYYSRHSITVNPMVVVFPQGETVIDVIVNFQCAIRYHIFVIYPEISKTSMDKYSFKILCSPQHI